MNNFNCRNKVIDNVCEIFLGQIKKSNTTIDTIVIGSGASGLTAARNLAFNGQNVLVLESRDRIGGRVHDITLKGMGKIPLGAAWLHTKGHFPILKSLLDKLDVRYMDIDSLKNTDSIQIYTPNKKLSSTENKKFIKILQNLPKVLKKYSKSNPDMTVSKAIHELYKDKMEPELINALVTRGYEHCGMNADLMPIRELDGWEPNGQFIYDGFGKLLKKISQGLNIKLNTPVTDIIQESNGVFVKTKNGVFRAKNVLCTIPIGVLQSGIVNFNPKLPLVKRRALSHLNSGNHEKIFFKFNEVFWDKNKIVFQYASKRNRGLCTQWYNVLLPTKNKKILYTNLSGPDIKYANRDLSELKKIGMDILRKMFGDNIPEPTDVYNTSWSIDKYTMGGPYGHPKVNGTMEDLDIMGEKFGKVYFGGVDTSKTETETVEAAILSGFRSSNELLNDLK